MRVIHPGDLRSACRALHERAGGDYILPALIRTATQDGPPSRAHAVRAGDIDIVFSVSHEPTAACLPLSFAIAATRMGRSVEIDTATRHEFIRAFFLGACAPLIVERRAGTTIYDMRLQLAPAYYAACGELHDETGEFAREDVCERLGAALVDLSQAFFASPAVCLSVWRSRILHELFGEAPVGLAALGPPLIGAAEPPAAPAVSYPATPLALPRERTRPQATGRWKLAAIVALSLLGGAALGRLGPTARLASPPPATTSQNDGHSNGLAHDLAPARPRLAATAAADVEPAPGEPSIPIRISSPGAQRSADTPAAPTGTTPELVPAVWALDDPFEAALPLASDRSMDSRDDFAGAPLPPPRPKTRASARPVPVAGPSRKNPLGVLGQAATSVAQVVRRIRTGSFKVTALNSPYAVRQ